MSRPGENRLRVDGRFLARGAERVFLKGVTFGPFPPGEELDPATEFARMAACGFNAIRVYTAPDARFLDTAGEHGLTVLAGLPWLWWQDFLLEPRHRTEGEMRLLEFIREHGAHPALGAVLVANEIPSDLARWMGPVAVRRTLEELIDASRAEQDDLLVAYSNYPSTEYLEPRNADFTAVNVYLEDREALRRYLPRLQNIAGDRPVLITEYGLDTTRNGEEAQDEALSWHLDECLEAGVAGTTFFAWSDLWFNEGHTVTDWTFGLNRTDGSERPALASLKKSLPGIRTHRDALSLTDPPRISVVVCTHNGSRKLDACLEACLAIDYPDFEVIVVDDGSTDHTVEIVKRYPEVSYVHQEHAGLSVARNRGTEAADGAIIAYTDDDCEPDCDWLFWLAREFRDPEAAAAGGPNLPPEPEGLQEAVVASAPGAPSHILLDDHSAEHLPGCNLAVRREAFEAVGGFQPQFKAAGDDVDFCWRLLDAGWRLAFAPTAFVWHRRRTSFLHWMRQQIGYGRAEALLYEAHPERFDRAGIAWEGCVYAGGAVAADPHAVIYFGAMGQALYQGLQRHAMPRRDLERHHDGIGAKLLLKIAELSHPWSRALARWRHGGPRPQLLPARGGRKTYRDDLRQMLEVSFGGDRAHWRDELLVALQAEGWMPCDETEAWDLDRAPFRVLTATEKQGPEYAIVRVRLLYPPGLRREGLEAVAKAAASVGMRRLS